MIVMCLVLCLIYDSIIIIIIIIIKKKKITYQEFRFIARPYMRMQIITTFYGCQLIKTINNDLISVLIILSLLKCSYKYIFFPTVPE